LQTEAIKHAIHLGQISNYHYASQKATQPARRRGPLRGLQNGRQSPGGAVRRHRYHRNILISFDDLPKMPTPNLSGALARQAGRIAISSEALRRILREFGFPDLK
jgi:hypothetical protein